MGGVYVLFCGWVQASGEVSEGGACTAVSRGMVGGVWGVGGAVGVVALAVFEALLQVRWQVFA